MHRNYFVFEHQVFFINTRLQGATISRCFTHRRNELVLDYISESSGFLRIGLQPSIPYLLLDPARNIKEPSFAFFERLNGEKIVELSITPYDKLVTIHFARYRLICKFYGADPNIYLTGEDGSVTESFKKIGKDEGFSSPSAGGNTITGSDLANFDFRDCNQTAAEFFTTRAGAFNNTLTRELLYRAQINAEVRLSGLALKEWRKLIRTYESLTDELKQGKAIVYEHPSQPAVLSLVVLEHLASAYRKTSFDTLNQAWKQFLYIHFQKNELQRQLQRSLSVIKKRIDYLHRSLKKISDFDQLEEKKKQAELRGHLLQTYAAEIPRGAEEVRLKNIFSAQGEKIRIRLNPAITLQENARKFFEKYKHIDTLKSDLAAKRNTYSHELDYWQRIYDQSVGIDSLKKAEKLTELLVTKKMIQVEAGQEQNQATDSFSFNHLLLDQKWEILIGKNAKNNDLLTFRFAHKHDIWLHAQGVPGSHVIIHLQDKNQQPPMEIIEKAARIAAYFSAAKTSGIVPVNFTTVRYVRKPRNAPAGTVTLSHEKTIFVEPKKYL